MCARGRISQVRYTQNPAVPARTLGSSPTPSHRSPVRIALVTTSSTSCDVQQAVTLGDPTEFVDVDDGQLIQHRPFRSTVDRLVSGDREVSDPKLVGDEF
ncbi:hypothetical protein C491_01322 [Natronococcus amylolyticus DSM 10524]|uniref:Uncharacterized protein n=1 Tax=Natronococcus amylolyticus DSM 10524 TaxID=1227497 RepID=L9XJ69_9EURY|nr:hypothetical protein C491_01322 [Natronococcus amylolyticus DSM 10524]